MPQRTLLVVVPSLHIGKTDLDAIREHARGGFPDEVCGVIVGSRKGDDIVVERVVPTRNAHENPRSEYLIPPEEMLSLVLRAEDEWGLEVVGFYHSHPIGPPHLSQRDRARASWPNAAYLLVWVTPEMGVGCWTWAPEAGGFVPRDVVVR